MKIALGLLVFIGCMGFNNNLFAQKRLLDNSTANTWPVIKNPNISNDGRFIAYLKKSGQATQLIIQDTNGKWEKVITSAAGDYQFTEDSHRIIYTLPNDSLALLELGSSTTKYIAGVEKFEIPENGDGRWLVCRLKDTEHDLVVMDLQQNTETKYPGVGEFQFSPNGNVIIMQTTASKDNPAKVYWLDPANGKKRCIGSGYSVMRIVFDKAEQQLAYISTVKVNGGYKQALHYYQTGMDSAKILVDKTTPGMEGMIVNGGLNVSFSKLGDRIFFGIGKQTDLSVEQAPVSAAKLRLRHYRDNLSAYKENAGPFLAVVHLNNPVKVIRLQQKEDTHWGFYFGGGNDDGYIAVQSNVVNCHARPSDLMDLFLVSTADGTRKLIKSRLSCYVGRSFDLNETFTPTGGYFIWYDMALKHWFAYNITNGNTNNITKSIRTPLYQVNDVSRMPQSEGIAGWLKNDKAVLIYDRNDIWQADFDGKLPCVNITKGFGIKHNTRLRLLRFGRDLPMLSYSDTLLMGALNLHTKENGFSNMPLTAHSHLNQLIMRPEVYYYSFSPNTNYVPFSGRPEFLDWPLKAKNANTYLLARMSATEYPNLNITSDFIHFKQLTNLAPQKEYNWYTTELVRWKLSDGKSDEGILYKPENFDPQKKYPIIFFYYERSADALNLFLNPELSFGSINIPWFVSNGYLVFVPDISYKIGHPGESAYNAVVSAAQMLAKKPWVDARKMGIQGHSFGGYETNYIASHTHLFAAAVSAAGLCNFTSGYGDDDRQSFYETEQTRVGASLWEKPNLYISNSPVFRADRVTTPFLIMHNVDDGSVSYRQGEEWYSNLAWLGKKAWMVSYSGEGHSIYDPTNQLDYSIRLGQFFDYYLKGALPPKWMTGDNESLELDHSGKKP